MYREFVIKFEPIGGGNWVDAEAFAESITLLLSGLQSLSNAVAPAIAIRRSWSRQTVKKALRLAVGAVRQGSVELAMVPGGVNDPPLDSERIAAIGLRSMAIALDAAARGETRIADVPGSAARDLSRSAKIAREANVRLSISCRRRVNGRERSPWRKWVDVSKLESGLSDLAERRAIGEVATTQLVGQIVAITFAPPGFVIETGRGKKSISMPARLRDKAHANWGKEVVVDARATITEDGDTRDAEAIDIHPTPETNEEFDKTFGLLSKEWGTPEADEYFDSLRRKH